MSLLRPLLFLVTMPGLLAVSHSTFADHGEYVYDVTPESAEIDPRKLRSYRAIWKQLRRGDEGLIDSGTTFEEILRVKKQRIEHTQIVRAGDVAITEMRTFDPDTLLPLSLHRDAVNAPAGQPQAIALSRQGNSWTGTTKMTEDTEKPFKYDGPVSAFDGWVAGLTLAALPLAEGYEVRLPTVVQLQQATYLLHARVKGKKDFKSDSGVVVPVWIVETDWVNVADGSVSHGGEHKSGGMYLVAVSPKKNQPHVIEYANNGAVIRWAP